MNQKIKIILVAIFMAHISFAGLNLDDGAEISSNQPLGFAGKANDKPVELIADPNVNLNRVPAPAKFMSNAAATSTININFLPANSADAKWGDITIAWPNAAKNIMLRAAEIWSTQLTSSQPIEINVGWVNSLDYGVLGHSGSLKHYINFNGAPENDTWYPATLANKLSGKDLEPSNADIYMGFSSSFAWYLGTDGNTPNDEYDLLSVALHEICHGLGFAGSMSVSGTSGSWGGGTSSPLAYDRFAEDFSGGSLLDTVMYPNYSSALKAALTSNNLFFNGTAAMQANGGNRVPIYAPSTWNPGSSYSHLAEIYNNTPNSLMTYSLGFGESAHDPGNITLGLLSDIGWGATGGGGGDDPVVQPFEMKSFKCTIKWPGRKSSSTSGRGNLTVSGSMPCELSDLSYLENSYVSEIINVTGASGNVTGAGSEFNKINSKKTVVTYKQSNPDSGFKRSVKLKLKKGRLYLSYKTVKGYSYESPLGLAANVPMDWTAKNLQLDFCPSYGGTIVSSRWNGTVMTMTKENKKSMMKYKK